MRRVVVYVDNGRRIVVKPTGGLDLECLVLGVGWVLDNDADVADSVIAAHLADGMAALAAAMAKLDGAGESWTAEAILRQEG